MPKNLLRQKTSRLCQPAIQKRRKTPPFFSFPHQLYFTFPHQLYFTFPHQLYFSFSHLTVIVSHQDLCYISWLWAKIRNLRQHHQLHHLHQFRLHLSNPNQRANYISGHCSWLYHWWYRISSVLWLIPQILSCLDMLGSPLWPHLLWPISIPLCCTASSSEWLQLHQ